LQYLLQEKNGNEKKKNSRQGDKKISPDKKFLRIARGVSRTWKSIR
jgi:hypothetical protein